MVDVSDINPPLTIVSLDFIEKSEIKLEREFGNITKKVVYLFGEESDEVCPCVVVHTYANTEQRLYFSLDWLNGRLNFSMPIRSLEDIDPEDILYTIKSFCDRTDFEKLHLEILETGWVSGSLHPHQIN